MWKEKHFFYAHAMDSQRCLSTKNCGVSYNVTQIRKVLSIDLMKGLWEGVAEFQDFWSKI